MDSDQESPGEAIEGTYQVTTPETNQRVMFLETPLRDRGWGGLSRRRRKPGSHGGRHLALSSRRTGSLSLCHRWAITVIHHSGLPPLAWRREKAADRGVEKDSPDTPQVAVEQRCG
jgi:hypothetical protein